MMKNRFVRFSVSTAVGVIVAVMTGYLLEWPLAPLAGWDVFVVALTLQIFADFARDTPDGTAKMARQDALNHSVLDTIVLVTSVASLGAVISLITGKNAGVAHIIFGLVSIMLSWVAVQVLFTLRYATLYYKEDEGGIDFNNKVFRRPRFSDFAYLAFTVGMTYQVSDTVITDYRIRRAVLTHALISFVFGVVIIASTINFMVGLAQ